MISDKDTLRRLRELLDSEPELLRLFLKIVRLTDILDTNIRLGELEAPIQTEMERVGGGGRNLILGLLSDVVLVRELRFIGDKNGLRQDSSRTQRVFLSKDTGQTLTTGVEAAVVWEVEVLDTDDMFSSTNNTRITFRAAGIYAIGANIIFAPNGVGERRIQLTNSAGTVFGQSSGMPPTVFRTGLQSTVIYDAPKDDYFEVQAIQSSGGNLNLSTTSGNRNPNFWAHRWS